MRDTPLDAAVAARVETAEAEAWADLYAAAPARFARDAGLCWRRHGGAVALQWAATGRRYFSRVVGLGVSAPADQRTIDAILDEYASAGIEMFLLQSLPHCRPSAYEGWLVERGLEPFDRQDRIVRGAQPLRGGRRVIERDLAVEEVQPAGAGEWSEFLQHVYGLDTGPWLPQLIGRAGWHQYVARERGEIVAARAMHVRPDGMAWLGMDGPVPGIHTDDYEPDAAICERIVQDGLKFGVRMFIADIEAPSERMDTPAYHDFGALGFTRPYVRAHHARARTPASG